MKIKIDKDKCIGCGTCIALAPNTFQLNDENKSVVKDEKGDPEETVLEAAKACPVGAIEIYNDEGKKIWPSN